MVDWDHRAGILYEFANFLLTFFSIWNLCLKTLATKWTWFSISKARRIQVFIQLVAVEVRQIWRKLLVTECDKRAVFVLLSFFWKLIFLGQLLLNTTNLPNFWNKQAPVLSSVVASESLFEWVYLNTLPDSDLLAFSMFRETSVPYRGKTYWKKDRSSIAKLAKLQCIEHAVLTALRTFLVCFLRKTLKLIWIESLSKTLNCVWYVKYRDFF